MIFEHFKSLIPIFVLGVNVLIQIICFRFFPGRGLLFSEFFGFIVGALFLLLLEIRINFSLLIVNAFSYVALSYCYFHFVNLGETARRIRILRELKDDPQGLSLEELLKRYNSAEILERRLNRLIKSGQITERDGHYFIGSPVLLLMAKILVFFKLLLFGKRSELGK